MDRFLGFFLPICSLSIGSSALQAASAVSLASWNTSSDATLSPLAIGSLIGQAGTTAQAAEGSIGTDKWGDKHQIGRPKNFQVSLLKLGLVVLVFLLWVRMADWINRDCQHHNLGYAKWNAIGVFPFVGAMLFVFLLPFAIGFSILVLVFLSVFFVYVVVHNRSVSDHEKVLTPAWWRFVFAGVANKLGLKVAAERVPEYEKGPKVDLVAQGSDQGAVNQANLLKARQSPGYVFLKELIADMITKRSDRVLLDYNQQNTAQRYQIDGVWHGGDPREREPADVMLAVIKTLANLDINERQKRQIGTLLAKYQDHTYTAHVESQGTKTGERVLFRLDDNKLPFKTLSELGVREKTSNPWLEQLGTDRGLVILATLPGGGLTTLIDTSIEDTDRLMRDWAAVEDLHIRERELENVDVTTYDVSKNETPVTVLPALIRKYPNVYVIRDFVTSETAELLFREIEDDRLVITSVRSKDAAEALLRLLAIRVPQQEFASVVSAVFYQRLIRKLCDDCKVAYEPTPDILQKLGIPSGRIQSLYRAPKPEEVDKPCERCHGIGFMGRTGIFELLIVNDEIREILAKKPELELIRRAARASGMRSLQEEGILLVAKGVTSLPELMRVLKQ